MKHFLLSAAILLAPAFILAQLSNSSKSKEIVSKLSLEEWA
jgi:hypothetical protein